MRRGSLRVRLLAAGAASIVLALAVAGFGLLLLFERHVERRMAVELEAHLRQLLSSLEQAGDGSLRLAREPADPRFQEPLSGLYWQVAVGADGQLLRSRSLWDGTLDLAPDALADGEVHEHAIAGPRGTSLLVLERAVKLPATLGGHQVRVAAAVDRAEIHAAGRAYVADLAPSLALLAAVLVAAGWLQIAVGLRPLDAVRRRLADVRSGREGRLGTAFPDEVLPLAAEVDHLLKAQEKAIARARARAADLAHSLKSPLTVLAADAEELRAEGAVRLGDEIAGLTEGMRRYVERELARARAGIRARAGAEQPVKPSIDQVVGVLRRTPRGGSLAWEIDVADDLGAPVDAQDLVEILGNLAENAAQWAAAKVRVSGRRDGAAIVLSVEDDGPGVPEDRIGTVLVRGGRLDETQPGSGLGLAIVAELVEAYGGALTLGRSPLGGLCVELRFPAAATAADLRTPASAP
jgi:signal transduction histidine kinase